MLTPTGIITPVRVNDLIPRECFCMLYAQRGNLFGMRAVLCSYLLPATCYLRLISCCVMIFIYKCTLCLNTLTRSRNKKVTSPSPPLTLLQNIVSIQLWTSPSPHTTSPRLQGDKRRGRGCDTQILL